MMRTRNGVKPATGSAASPKRVSKYGTRLRMGSYFADIVPDPQGNRPIQHWIVQRTGSPQILFMGQEADLETALERTHQCLEEISRKRGGQHGGAIYEFATAVRPGPIVMRSRARAASSDLRPRSSRRSSESVPDRSE
jgi:hypothetical protein